MLKYSNLHNHTLFSDGSQAPRENIEQALRLGMGSIGFSDHSYTFCDSSYCMKLERYPEYIKEIRGLAEEYRDRIPVYVGIEKDYYSHVNNADFDYVIGSVHYIIEGGVTYPIDHSLKDQRRCIDEGFGGDLMAMAERYYSLVAEHAEVAKPTFIGHFDVLNKFGIMPEEDPAYIRLTLDALEKTVKHCPYFEINTGGISRGYRSFPYPSPYLMEHLREMGGSLLLGADSHHIKNLTFFFDEAVDAVRRAGFKTLAVFNGKDFDQVEI